MAEKLNLPRSSFEELKKIIKGYSHTSNSASLDELSKLTGMNKTVISRNNKFLHEIGIIDGGNKKAATDLGKKLGRAIDYDHDRDMKKYWKEAVQFSEGVSGLVTTVRIKGGMTEKEFTDHVLYVSGQKNNAGNRTGSRTLVDILMAGGLIEEVDGKLVVASSNDEYDLSEDIAEDHSRDETPLEQKVTIENKKRTKSDSINTSPQIAINIQLHLPETENADIYEKLFKALREQLINPSND
ncbi:MAG: hypothetical protein WEA58_08895 [Balneolaceae bacterium]